jgi:hypothetical protein
MAYSSDRFDFDDYWRDHKPAPADAEIIKRSHQLKLHIYRHEDGGLSVDFELQGSFGELTDEGGQDSTPDGMQFVRGLLAAMERGRPEGQGGCCE